MDEEKVSLLPETGYRDGGSGSAGRKARGKSSSIGDGGIRKHSAGTPSGYHAIDMATTSENGGYQADVSKTSLEQHQERRRSRQRSMLARLSFNEVSERIALTWHDINVWAPAKTKGICGGEEAPAKQILHGVSGSVQPGSLLAIMGASGAGKTTLLNVLTYRNRGQLMVEGDVRVNGGQIGKGMSSMSAYIQQEDLFIGTLKVKEHLWFQAQLRMDKSVPYELRQRRIEAVMQEMSLTKCADAIIGIPGKIKCISGGEKKRLAVASEILTNPPLMFCDEPTSGLDSFMAQNIINTLRKMASKGRTILCTIHQPSSEVFALFDKLLFVAEGRVAYLGPSAGALDFFNKCGYPCPPIYNPADHYIQTLAIVPGKESKCRERVAAICEEFTRTPQAEELRKDLDQAHDNVDDDLSSAEYHCQRLEVLAFPVLPLEGGGSNLGKYDEGMFSDISPYRASWIRQFMVVFWRSWLGNAREPAVLKTRLIQSIVIGVLAGLLYYQTPYDQSGITNINGALFLMLNQMTYGFVFGVINSFPPEFPIFIREHFNGMYRVDVYFLSKTFSEVPQYMMIPTVFTVIIYWLVGLYPSAEAFLITLVTLLLVCNTAVSFGYVLSSSSSNVSLVLALGPIFIVPAMMISGIYIDSSTIPPEFLWLKYLSWYTYSNEILVVNQWRHVKSLACDVTPANQTALLTSAVGGCLSSGQQIIENQSYSEDNLWFDFLMLVVLFVGYRILAFIILSLRARQSYNLVKPKDRSGNKDQNVSKISKFFGEGKGVFHD